MKSLEHTIVVIQVPAWEPALIPHLASHLLASHTHLPPHGEPLVRELLHSREFPVAHLTGSFLPKGLCPSTISSPQFLHVMLPCFIFLNLLGYLGTFLWSVSILKKNPMVGQELVLFPAGSLAVKIVPDTGKYPDNFEFGIMESFTG